MLFSSYGIPSHYRAHRRLSILVILKPEPIIHYLSIIAILIFKNIKIPSVISAYHLSAKNVRGYELLRKTFCKESFAAFQDLLIYSLEISGIPGIIDILRMRGEIHKKMNLSLGITAEDTVHVT